MAFKLFSRFQEIYIVDPEKEYTYWEELQVDNWAQISKQSLAAVSKQGLLTQPAL